MEVTEYKIQNKISFMKFVKKNFKSVKKLEEVLNKNIGDVKEPLRYIFEKSLIINEDGKILDFQLEEIFNIYLNWSVQCKELLFDSQIRLEQLHTDWKKIVQYAKQKNIQIIFNDIEIKKLNITFDGE